MDIRQSTLNSSYSSPGSVGGGKLPPGGVQLPPGNYKPIELPKVDLDTVSISNGAYSSPGNPGTGEVPPNADLNFTFPPNAKPMPMPQYPGNQTSPGFEGTGEVPPNADLNFTFPPNAKPMPMPQYDPGSLFNSVV